MSNAFAAPHFHSHELAREWLEQIRWPDGPVCSHCGTVGHAYKTKKPGWYRCAQKACRKDFTVTTGTVMERSHIELHKWLIGFYLMSSSKKGVSAHQLHRALGLDYKSAWFMAHRIREAMRADGTFGPLGAAKARSSKLTKPITATSISRAPRRRAGALIRRVARPGISARSWLLSNVAAMSARSMFRSPTRRLSLALYERTSRGKAAFIPMKAASIAVQTNTLPLTRASSTRLASTPATKAKKRSTPTRPKAISL